MKKLLVGIVISTIGLLGYNTLAAWGESGQQQEEQNQGSCDRTSGCKRVHFHRCDKGHTVIVSTNEGERRDGSEVDPETLVTDGSNGYEEDFHFKDGDEKNPCPPPPTTTTTTTRPPVTTTTTRPEGCDEDCPTTTTTRPPVTTTTTRPPVTTTTTLPPTSTTTTGPVTTTTQPPPPTTTTRPPVTTTTIPTTTVPAVVTPTTTATVPPVTVLSTTIPADNQVKTELPRTGSASQTLGFIGLALVVAGALSFGLGKLKRTR